jgi:hypothetical protein
MICGREMIWDDLRWLEDLQHPATDLFTCFFHIAGSSSTSDTWTAGAGFEVHSWGGTWSTRIIKWCVCFPCCRLRNLCMTLATVGLDDLVLLHIEISNHQ